MDTRPDFMVTLGLAPPYVKEDIKKAYLEKAKLAHPDRGGTVEAFNALHEAFERAEEFVKFRGDRRAWIAARMERYVALERAIERLRDRHVAVSTFTPDWLANSFGDFAQLTESAELARALEPDRGDELIDALVAESEGVRGLMAIELVGCRISDAGVLRLGVFRSLKRLNLANTPITSAALAVIDELPSLEWIGLAGTRVGWWAKYRAEARLKKRVRH